MKKYSLCDTSRASKALNEKNNLKIAVELIGQLSYFREAYPRNAEFETFYAYSDYYEDSYAARNRGIEIISVALKNHDLVSSKRKMKRYLETTAGKHIRSDTYLGYFAAETLRIIRSECFLEQAFGKKVLLRCRYFDNDINNPTGIACAQWLLGFQFECIRNLIGRYNEKKNDAIEDCWRTIVNAIANNSIPRICHEIHENEIKKNKKIR